MESHPQNTGTTFGKKKAKKALLKSEGKEGVIMGFEGFPREFPDFFFLLSYNNTMELLPVNKVKYRSLITEPLTLLYHRGGRC